MEHHTTAGFSVRAVDERAAADVRREVLGEEGEEDSGGVVPTSTVGQGRRRRRRRRRLGAMHRAWRTRAVGAGDALQCQANHRDSSLSQGRAWELVGVSTWAAWHSTWPGHRKDVVGQGGFDDASPV